MPALTFPMATLMYFQFVFAAITVIILAGSLLGRMNFTAWMIFCPVWMTLVYTVGAFSLWGGGWLAGLGVADFSGGYVIHLAAGTSGFVAAAVIGPRLQADRDNFPPNSLLITLVGAGILWLGWNGFNGGDPYFANADAGAAVMNTNTATAVGAAGLDADGQDGLRQAVGARRRQRHDRRPGGDHTRPPVTSTAGARSSSASSPASFPGSAMNKLQKTRFMMKVDDTLSVFLHPRRRRPHRRAAGRRTGRTRPC